MIHIFGQKPKLLDQVRYSLRQRNYSYHTEQSYLSWIKRFILLLSLAFLYNEDQINIHDVRGDQYPALPFRESPAGVRGLDWVGEIPSVLHALRHGASAPAGASFAVSRAAPAVTRDQ